jgi:hypothetical protein
MAANAKTDAWARQLKDNLTQRLSTATMSIAYDSSSDVYVKVTVGSGNNSLKSIIRLKPVTLLGTDIFGNTAVAVTPHVAQVLFDDTTHGTTTTDALKLAVWGEVMALGCKVEGYTITASGSVITISSFGSATAAGTFDPLPYTNIMAS